MARCWNLESTAGLGFVGAMVGHRGYGESTMARTMGEENTNQERHCRFLSCKIAYRFNTFQQTT